MFQSPQFVYWKQMIMQPFEFWQLRAQSQSIGPKVFITAILTIRPPPAS